MENRPIIALVGRPNVGKSTVFNRLIGRREAITSFIAGTTRDRNFGIMDWFGNSWTIIDTAGVIYEEDEDNIASNNLQKSMEEQVEIAVSEATLVALVVDVKEGMHPIEKRLVNELRKHNKPVIVLANKADNEAFRTQAEMFRELGIDEIFPISGIHGSGVGDLTDYLIKHFPSPPRDDRGYMPHVAFIGRPNVGKSTLLNRVVGVDRSIVSPVAGTTRDAVQDKIILPGGQQVTVVDTAGIRRRGQIEAGIEKFSLFRALKAINRSEVVVLLLTIEENPTRGDAHVAMYALEAEKKIILAINKSDLSIENIFKLKPSERERLADRYLKRFAFLQRMPTYFISADTGEGVPELLKAVEAAVTEEK